MKKLVAIGMLAIALFVASEQEASAWINSRFGIGLEFGWQSAGNSWGWGAFHNGHHPGYGYSFGHHGASVGFNHTAPAMAPMPTWVPAYEPHLYATMPGQAYYDPAPFFFYLR
jgi:hypothetical protein